MDLKYESTRKEHPRIDHGNQFILGPVADAIRSTAATFTTIAVNVEDANMSCAIKLKGLSADIQCGNSNDYWYMV